MTAYVEHSVKLSDGQLNRLVAAIDKSSAINIKLNHDALDGNIKLLLTPTQMKSIAKSKKNKKGLMLKLSKNQIMKMRKSGGALAAIIPFLAPAAASLLSPLLVKAGQWITDKIEEAVDSSNSGGAIFQLGAREVPSPTTPSLGSGTGGAIFQLGASGGSGQNVQRKKKKRGGMLFPNGIKDTR